MAASKSPGNDFFQKISILGQERILLGKGIHSHLQNELLTNFTKFSFFVVVTGKNLGFLLILNESIEKWMTYTYLIVLFF